MSIRQLNQVLERSILSNQDLLRIPAQWTQWRDEATTHTRFRFLCYVCLRSEEVNPLSDQRMESLWIEGGERRQAERLGMYIAAHLQRSYAMHSCLYTDDPKVITWEQAQVVYQRLERTLDLLGDQVRFYKNLGEEKLLGVEPTLLRCRHPGPVGSEIVSPLYDTCDCPPLCHCRNQANGNCRQARVEEVHRNECQHRAGFYSCVACGETHCMQCDWRVHHVTEVKTIARACASCRNIGRDEYCGPCGFTYGNRVHHSQESTTYDGQVVLPHEFQLPDSIRCPSSSMTNGGLRCAARVGHHGHHVAGSLSWNYP